VKEQELTLILVDLLTRLTLATESLADSGASIVEMLRDHAEVFTAANDEGSE